MKKQLLSSRMGEAAFQMIAAQFKVLAEPMRLQLLNELHDGEKTVTQLIKASGANQANVSKHLSILANAGMVGRRKAGLNAYYFIADDTVFKLCDLMCSKLQRELEQKASFLP